MIQATIKDRWPEEAQTTDQELGPEMLAWKPQTNVGTDSAGYVGDVPRQKLTAGVGLGAARGTRVHVPHLVVCSSANVSSITLTWGRHGLGETLRAKKRRTLGGSQRKKREAFGKTSLIASVLLRRYSSDALHVRHAPSSPRPPPLCHTHLCCSDNRPKRPDRRNLPSLVVVDRHVLAREQAAPRGQGHVGLLIRVLKALGK